jgi:hypothetical protein
VIWVKLKGGIQNKVEVRTESAIQVSSTLALAFTDFFDNQVKISRPSLNDKRDCTPPLVSSPLLSCFAHQPISPSALANLIPLYLSLSSPAQASFISSLSALLNIAPSQVVVAKIVPGKKMYNHRTLMSSSSTSLTYLLYDTPSVSGQYCTLHRSSL